jgi:hypothetical protein
MGLNRFRTCIQTHERANASRRACLCTRCCTNPNNFKGFRIGFAAVALVDFLEEQVGSELHKLFLCRLAVAKNARIHANLNESNELIHSAENNCASN